jgi:hypothetical protein
MVTPGHFQFSKQISEIAAGCNNESERGHCCFFEAVQTNEKHVVLFRALSRIFRGFTAPK